MTETHRPSGPTRFEDLLATWGGRPVPTAPADARRRVMAALPDHPARAEVWQFAAAAALLIGVFAAVFATAPGVRWPVGDDSLGSGRTAAVDPNVVVWILDDGTPFYFMVDPADSREKGKPS